MYSVHCTVYIYSDLEVSKAWRVCRVCQLTKEMQTLRGIKGYLNDKM